MNIFILDTDPELAAEMMLDKHIVKMPTESMQMISTIMDLHGFNTPMKSSCIFCPYQGDAQWTRHKKNKKVWKS